MFPNVGTKRGELFARLPAAQQSETFKLYTNMCVINNSTKVRAGFKFLQAWGVFKEMILSVTLRVT